MVFYLLSLFNILIFLHGAIVSQLSLIWTIIFRNDYPRQSASQKTWHDSAFQNCRLWPGRIDTTISCPSMNFQVPHKRRKGQRHFHRRHTKAAHCCSRRVHHDWMISQVLFMPPASAYKAINESFEGVVCRNLIGLYLRSVS